MKQLEKLMNNQEERIYTIGDLENLSASRLYGFDPSRPLGSFSISPISQPSFPNLSHQFSYLDSYGKKEKEKPSQNKYDPLNFLSKKSEPLKKSKPLMYNPIGSLSNFNKEGPKNISFNFNLGRITPETIGYSLTERYDVSHNQFHLNQDIVKSGTTSPLINSGISKKKKDGYKGLGSAHHISLFDLDK